MAFFALLAGCDELLDGAAKELGTECELISFKMGAEDEPDSMIPGEIDQEAKTVVIELPAEPPGFAIVAESSPGSTVSPLQGEHPAEEGEPGTYISMYRVTSEDGKNTRDYTVYKIWIPVTQTGDGDGDGTDMTLTGGPLIDTTKNGDPNINGGVLAVTADSDKWPANVSRSTGSGKVTTFVLTATPGYDDYRWYVDGEVLVYFDEAGSPSPRGNVADPLLGTNYSAGNHVLFLVAIKSGVPYTFTQSFTVVS
jgi:hypothetical protein